MRRFLTIGAGFWSRVQLAAWGELAAQDVACVGVCDTDRDRAEALARRHGIDAAFDDPAAAIDALKPDFVDIVTPPDTHRPLVELAARKGVRGIVCQKPLAPTMEDAQAMADVCRDAGAALFVHENWRFQTPLRALKAVLDTGAIGDVFRARLSMVSGFPVFDNQPLLARLERFLLADMGVHTLDTARYLFGEATWLAARIQRVHPAIAGEDVATVLLATASGATVDIHMAFAQNPLGPDECFPQTLAFVEGTRGAIRLDPGYRLRVTTAAGTRSRRVPPPTYPWADPAYAVVQASVVDCCADLLAGLRGQSGRGETRADDNLRTLALVFGAYDCAASGQTLTLGNTP